MKKFRGSWLALWAIFTLGSAMIVGRNPLIAGNAYLMLLIGFVLVIPMYFIYNSAIQKTGEHDVFILLERAFGKGLSGFIILLYIIYVFLSAITTLSGTINTIRVNALPHTSRVLIGLCAVLPAAYGAYKGGATLGRAAQILFPLIAILLGVSIAASLAKMDIKHIFPIMGEGVERTLMGGMIFAFVPFSEAIILCGIRSEGSPKGINLVAGGISAVIIALSYLRNQLVLGNHWIYSQESYQYILTRYADIGSLVERMDLPSVTSYLAIDIIKMSICLLFIIRALQKVFFHKAKPRTKGILSLFVALVVCTLSVAFKMGDTISQLLYNCYAYISGIFGIGIPLVMILTLALRRRLKPVEVVMEGS